MARTYTLKRRAEQQAETRRRIVEAAVDLHGSVGPARRPSAWWLSGPAFSATRSMRIFPTSGACFWPARGCAERDPLPDAAAWRAIEDRRERLRVGLARDLRLVRAQRRTDGMRAARRRASCADAERSPRCGSRRIWRPITRCSARKLGAKQRAMLRLALSFFTWRTLVRDGGLKTGAPVGAMVQAIDARDEPRTRALLLKETLGQRSMRCLDDLARPRQAGHSKQVAGRRQMLKAVPPTFRLERGRKNVMLMDTGSRCSAMSTTGTAFRSHLSGSKPGEGSESLEGFSSRLSHTWQR